MLSEGLPQTAHLLVVEDDGEMRTLIAKFLRQNGYRVTGVRDGREMWETLTNAPVDLVLLDVMLPGSSGLDLCRALRSKSQVPVIMVTARGDETDRVVGLELGADDYIPKPFSRAEMLARIRAVLRRAQAVPERPGALRRGPHPLRRLGARHAAARADGSGRLHGRSLGRRVRSAARLQRASSAGLEPGPAAGPRPQSHHRQRRSLGRCHGQPPAPQGRADRR